MTGMKTIKKEANMLATLHDTISHYRARFLVQTSRYRKALDDMAPDLYAYWRRTAQHEFEGIRQDAFFFASAAEGLLTFFDCVAGSRRPCALPSKAVDSVWHAWLRMAPQGLETFCFKHFGRVIPHVEGADMVDVMDEALANCLVWTRRRDGIDAAGPGVPRLFSLDHRLRMPHGFAYTLAAGDITLTHMNGEGKARGLECIPVALEPASLLEARLISRSEHDEAMRKRRQTGGGCGSGCGASAGCGSGCGGGGD
jgi:hypothetical protein